MGGRRCWGLALLGSTPEVYGGDHDLLLSLYPPAISASSLLEACVPIPPCCPWDARDGTSQGIPIQAGTESHCFPRDSPVGIPPSKTSLLHLALWASALSPAWDGHGHVGLCTHFAGAMTEEGGQLQGHAGSPGGIPLLKGFAQEQVMELLAAHSLPSPSWALLLSPGC